MARPAVSGFSTLNIETAVAEHYRAPAFDFRTGTTKEGDCKSNTRFNQQR